MRVSVLRRATLVALSAIVLVASAAPAVADSRPQKVYPTRQERYKPGRAFGPSTDVLSASGYAAWMIDEALGPRTPLPRLGAAFMRAERTYGVNARYFVAHALLESGWGSSAIARYKRNLFGYNAFDRDPWGHAASYPSYERGIMAVAERVRGSYLSPSGRYFFRFTTLRAMNVYYATDPRWADKIAHLANVVDRLVVTLKERGLRFGTPALRGAARAGAAVPLDIRWTARRGGLPQRLQFAVRWAPVTLVEADAVVPEAAPEAAWQLVDRKDRGGRTVRLALGVPAQPGLWRLDVAARDSDGHPLPETDDPPISSVVVRVAAAREADIALAAEGGRVAVTVRSVGSQPLAAWLDGTPTAVEAWAIPLDPDRPAHLLASKPLRSNVPPGGSRVVRFAAPREPAVIVVRLAGDPAAIGRSRPAAALVERERSKRVHLAPITVASPRDDVLLGRQPAAGRIGIVPSDLPGTVRAIVEPAELPSTVAAELAAAESAPPGPPALLLRSVAAEPARAAEPSTVVLPLAAAQQRPEELDVTGLPAGVRLVIAGIVPPDGGPLDPATLRLAWVPVGAVPDAAVAPH